MQGVSEDKLNKFFSQFNTIAYKKGEIILRAGDTPQGVNFIKKGYVRLNSISEDGKELTLVIYKKGELFPVVWSFFGRGPSIYSFEAIADSEILRAPREAFLDFIKTNSETLFELTKGIITRFRTSLRRMEYLTFGNASAKIASILLICAKDFGERKGNHIQIQIPLTHKDVANLVGLTRETASLALKKFERQKLISYNQKIIVIKNVKGLEQKAILS